MNKALLVDAIAVSAIMALLVVEFERRGGLWWLQDWSSFWRGFLQALGG